MPPLPWAHTRETAATDTPETAPTSTRYVGRVPQLKAIDAALGGALAHGGRIVLVSGDAGIGKSRLLAEAERLARERGVPVAWGRSPEADGAPPYWPWQQVLRASAVRAAEHARGSSAEFALAYRIAPDPFGRSVRLDDSVDAELHGAQRFGVFEAVAGLLRAAAWTDGLLVLLDDLHWADTPSLRLLEHLASDWAGTRGLLIAAHRPAGSERDSPLRHTLAQLSRHEATLRINLSGFSAEETAERLTDITGRSFAPATIAALQHRTSGNPFFIGEFAQLLATATHRDFDSERDVPPSVRDVLARRVSRLSPRTQDVLGAAAVVGAHPAPGVVAAVTGIPVAAVLESFDEAVSDGLLTCEGEPLEYGFAHALLRDALYAELTSAQRVSAHARVAMHLEQLPGADRASHLAELAHHWLRAVPAGHADEAARSATAAADADMLQLAYEEAARLYESAAGACAQRSTEPGRDAQLLLRAARAKFLGGDVDGSAALCEDVARRARATGDKALLAAAALVLEGVGDRQLSAMIAGLCEEALAALPGDDIQTRSRLLAQLAGAFVYLDDFARLDALSREALEGAERSGDDETLSAALHARHIACSGIGGLKERLSLTKRLLDLAQRAHRIIDEVWARLWQFDAAMQTGRIDDAERELVAVETLAERIRQPLIKWHVERCRFVVAHARGDFVAARRAADDGDRFARSAGELARRRRPMQYLILAVLTGDEIPEQFLAAGQASTAEGKALPQTAALLAGQTAAIASVLRGDSKRAAAIYDRLPGPDRWLAMPPSVLIASSHRALLAALLGRREDSAIMYARLLPYADLFASAGAGAVACFGSVELQLGLLQRTLGKTDPAVRHLERAVQRHDGAGMRPAAAESRYQLALTLQMRGRSGDVAAALPLVSASLEEAEVLGMRPLAVRATELRESLRAGTRQARALTPREMEIAKMVAEGLTSREIADAMHISSRTADNHVQHILDKLDLRSRSQIATWVAQRPRSVS